MTFLLVARLPVAVYSRRIASHLPDIPAGLEEYHISIDINGSHLRPRIAIFIDGSNLYHALEENCSRTDLNFPRFVHRLLRGRRLLRTYYYNILQESRRKPQAHGQRRNLGQQLSPEGHIFTLHNQPTTGLRAGTDSAVIGALSVS